MNFHGRQRAEIPGQFIMPQGQRFIGGFAADQFRSHAGYSNRRFTAKGLEACLINHLAPVILLKFHPQRSICRSRNSPPCPRDRIGQLAHILGISNGLPDFFLQRFVHDNYENS